MRISKAKWMALEKRVADLEREVQVQQRQLEIRLAPPMNDVIGLTRDAPSDGYYFSSNTGGGGGGRFKDDGLTTETLRNINLILSALCSIIKDGHISVDVKLK